MNTQEIEQVILAITQTMLLTNQLFMTKKMKEGMSKLGKDKDKLNDINLTLEKITELLSVLEDRLNDLVEKLNTIKDS